MQTQYKLSDRAVLMKLSAGLPGEARTDKSLTNAVKSEHSLGQKSGNWVKRKYPDWALEPLKKLVNEARAYHDAVTLPFDKGIGILPSALIVEHGDKMRDFKRKFENLINTHFVPRYPEMVAWAKVEHNGTFDASDYPPVDELLDCFYFKTEPLPVPDAGHFESAMKSLLGADADGLNLRVQDAMLEAQRELMRRMIDPVKAMAVKLAEQPRVVRDEEGRPEVNADGTIAMKDIVFRDTLVGNIKDIAALVPKLNIAGDAQLDSWAAEMEALTRYAPDTLRQDKSTRAEAARKADEMAKRMAAYNF